MANLHGIEMDYADLRTTLLALAERLDEPSDILVFGGAALILAYGLERTTQDMDAAFKSMDAAVARAAAEMNSGLPELGIPPMWLDTSFTQEVPAFRMFQHAQLLESLPSATNPMLRVSAVSAEYLLSMKCRAHRDKDVRDAVYLLGYLGMPGEDLVLERAFADFPERKAEPEASFVREFVRKAFSEIGR